MPNKEICGKERVGNTLRFRLIISKLTDKVISLDLNPFGMSGILSDRIMVTWI